MREKLNFNSLPETIQKMAEDNVGAAGVIDNLINAKGENLALGILIILDDMNIRGVQINTLYKLCNQDIEKFYDKIINITKKDIETLNFSSATLCNFKALIDGNKEDRKLNPNKYIFTEEERNKIRNKKGKNTARDILNGNINKQKEIEDDLYPSIETPKALEIIKKQGFICGYEVAYENKNKQKETYRVFYNKMKDIMYTHSLENIFLWKKCKLNAIRQNNNQEYINQKRNIYRNVEGIIGYNIDLRENPFKEYNKILKNNKHLINQFQIKHYDENLIPIIETIEGIKYKEQKHHYNDLIVSNLYNLLMFKETYKKLDKGLKEIYEPLLANIKQKAYDELIYHLNFKQGIEIAKNLQKLGITLDKDELFNAKARYYEKNKQSKTKTKFKFLSNLFSDDPWNEEISKRINKVLN